MCAIYNNERELADAVSQFLTEGLAKSERCWYVPASDDPSAIRAALEERGVDIGAATARGALRILPSDAVYSARNDFDPEATMAAFSNAIEEALSDGFTGFRAAANMSWALDLDRGAERVITYEALLKSLFASARATGLCLYDRRRMPLEVINGALSTHPLVYAQDRYRTNTFYDAGVRALEPVDTLTLASKLAHLEK